ncbi:RTC4-like domain-containing protein [Sparassis latifolia]
MRTWTVVTKQTKRRPGVTGRRCERILISCMFLCLPVACCRRFYFAHRLAELMRSDDMSDDDDSFFLDPNVDPASLCPWCDEKLPPVPTPHLSAMITTARHASSPDARPTNPLGLRAPLGAFVAVCQRHRFESHHVPLAQQKGWPMEITWELINARVEAQRARLQKIVQDVDERFLPGAPRVDGDEDENGDEELPSRSRMNSVFWKDVVKSVRMKGSRQTAGVRGQFASFSKTQPGYYGELGYFIIHQTIYNLFPPTSFDPDSALPLTPTDFIQLILVPEAAVELIMEDMNQSRTDAIETLRESAEYGVAMFPDDHSDGAAAVEAGDQLVMERAMARRKELEEEERLEDELWKAREGSENNKKGKTRGRAKGKARAKESEAGEQDLAGYDDDGNAKKGCRKRSRMTRGQSSGDRSEKDLDVIMLTDSADSCSEKQVKATSKRGRSNGSKFKCRTDRRMGSSDADMNVDTDGPVDSSNPQARPRPRPRPRAREPDTHLDKGEESENIHSSQEILRPVTRGHRGKTHIPPAKDEVIDIDATPKPKKRSRSPSEPRTTRDEDKAKHSLFPLQAARDRLKGTKRPNRRDEADLEMWSRQMTDPATSTDESAYSDTSVASKYSHHPTRHSPKPAEDNYHWLLSDPSTPSTSQSR